MLDGDDRFEWRKSTHCSSGACVEVAIVGDVVLVRDQAGQWLAISSRAWNDFLTGIRSGEFEVSPPDRQQ
jgi:hypothetical protein